MAYLNDMPRFTSKHSMEDTVAFLKSLGSPDEKLHTIHVAGTNGKGSVCAYLRGILEESGYSVGVFTSPHLVDIRERFVCRGKMMSREDFLKHFLDIYERLDWEALEREEEGAYHPTFFEYLFFMGICWFADQAPDYLILETGLGGRLDATNSVGRKDLAVITRISLDHVQYLGDTVEQIAGEKAGIIRPGVPVVYDDFVPESSAVFRKVSEELGAPAVPVSESFLSDLRITEKNIDFSLLFQYHKVVCVTLPTFARYQAENAAVAAWAAISLPGADRVNADSVIRGLGRTTWAGRMEEILPEVYLDGAHNEDGIRAFLDTVRGDGWQGKRRLVFGVVSDKDYPRMVEEIVSSGLFEEIIITQLHTSRSVTADRLEDILQQYPDIRYRLTEDASEALEQVLREREQETVNDRPRIYVAGSLYLVGEIRERFANDQL